MAQDKRIYSDLGRDIASTLDDATSATGIARSKLYEAIIGLAQAGYEFSDIQAFIFRNTVDGTRDIATYGIPLVEHRAK